MRLANLGYTIHEIPEQLQLPPGLSSVFANRGYYGTVSHNAKAQYQLYFGYFDANPANLNPLSPTAAGKKFVDYMGGSDKVIEKAQADYLNGEYRFAATALNHVVFAEPDNQTAKDLLANLYTQMGYLAESGSWRNFYLTAAQELRLGVARLPTPQTASPDMIRALPLDLFLDLMAVRLNGPKAAGSDMRLNFEISDRQQRALLILSNGTLHYRMGQSDNDATTIQLTRDALDRLNLKQTNVGKLLASGDMKIKGNPLQAKKFFSFIEEPPFWFNIVTP